MYLHLGMETIVRQEEILGIFDLDNCSFSHITRDFLKKAEGRGEIIPVFEDLPKSVVLTSLGNQNMLYLSQLSTTTLRGRVEHNLGFE